MENKITITSLASSIAQSTGKSRKSCEDFVKEFFKVVADNLKEGETLKIKGFGNFKLAEVESRSSVNVNNGEPIEIARHKKVVFTPAKELATAINAPFRDFESIEMEDEMPDEILVEDNEENNAGIFDILTSEEDNVGNENEVNDKRLEEGSDEELSDDEITNEAYTLIEEKIEEPTPGTSIEAANENMRVKEENIQQLAVADSSENENTIDMNGYDKTEKSRFGIGFLTGALSALLVCVVIFMLGCFFDWWPVNFENVRKISEPQATEQNEAAVSQNDEGKDSIQEPLTPPVYDTVSTTRYLTTIAREHYGDFNFWPYIYLENESILGHPDRITPGTKVVVPPLSKYDVDINNKADVQKAKALGTQIYSRYKK